MIKSIQDDIEFIAAALTQRCVSVSLRDKPDELILEGVTVEKITPYVIIVRRHDGNMFILMRSAVDFRG